MNTPKENAGSPPPLVDRLREALGVDVREVPGAVISGQIPVPAAVINRLIAERLAGKQTPVESATLEPRDGDTITAHIRVRVPRVLPPFKIALQIEQQPDLPDRPVFGLRWSLPGLGLLAPLVRPALAFFNALPPGITVGDDRIGIDIARLLHSRGDGDLLLYLRALRITTRDGLVVIEFHLKT